MTKVLILGGGFGGIRCALNLEKKLKDKAQITLIDKNGYHLFLPALYEVASAYDGDGSPFKVKMRKTICISFADIFDGKKINFIQAEIFNVDLKTKIVQTKGGEVLFYDYLILALGSQTADFNISGVKEYAYQFKSVNDAIAINIQIGKLIKKMVSGEKMDPLRILIGGAGFTGVELAAEISGCVKQRCQGYNNIKTANALVTLIEAGPKMLPIVSDKERNIISQRLTKLGVVLMENSAIEEVRSDSVKLRSGQTLEGDIVIWTAGIKANEFLKSIAGLPLTDKGKIMMNDNLQVQNWENVFAVGDNQEFIDPKNQKPVPALAYTAVEQAKVVAKNIFKLLSGGKNLDNYKPNYGAWIAPVGGKFALAHFKGGFVVSRFAGWVIREFVDLRYLISILTFRKGILLFWQEMKMFIKND